MKKLLDDYHLLKLSTTILIAISFGILLLTGILYLLFGPKNNPSAYMFFLLLVVVIVPIVGVSVAGFFSYLQFTKERHRTEELLTSFLNTPLPNNDRFVQFRENTRIQYLENRIELLVRENEQLKSELSYVKEQAEAEKQRRELDKQESSIEWQKEAITLVDISPRAAIIMAWIGIEKEIQQIARHIEINVNSLKRPINLIQILGVYEKIDKETEKTLQSMSKLRTLIVHGAYKEEITKDMALTFVQQAIEISEKLSSIEVSPLSE